MPRGPYPSRSEAGGLLFGLLPPTLVLLFATWCGTFGAGAGWAAAVVAHLLVLASAAAVVPSWRDPWRLGFPGLLLPWALLAAAVLAWWLSPVSRAGRVGLILFPAYLLLPAVAARLWGSDAARSWGARGVSTALALVAGAALALWLAGVTPRPSLPVGQHLHLTAWLVLLLPLAALPGRDRLPWRFLAGASVVLGAAAVLGSRSLAGGLALALQGGIALGWLVLRRRPGRPLRGRVREAVPVLALLAAGALLLGPDLAHLLRGRDPSAAARLVYWRAGWQGVTESPVAGLGPGSTAWTLAAFLRPVPGVNPPGEVVGELHLLPLALAYELGVPGALLAAAAAGLFGLRRIRERRRAADLGFLVAGLLGLTGGAVVGLGTADWRVAALPLAAALAAGAALAGGARPPGDPDGPGPVRGLRRVGWRDRVGAFYALGAALLLAPLDLAHRAYDRAVDAPRAEAVRRLDRAVALDPGFSLYRARKAWLEGESAAAEPAGAGELSRAASGAVRAAESGVGVAPLWLAAGSMAAVSGERWVAAAALERACALDPLGALAPFFLLDLDSPLHDPTALGARSLAAEPRLGAATFWRSRPDLLQRSLLTLAATGGIEEGWRAAVVERLQDLATRPREPSAPVDELALALDRTPADSVSLHAFRRIPWRARLAFVPVSSGFAAGLADLPPATALAGTDPRLFPPTCTGPFAPQALRKTLWKSW